MEGNSLLKWQKKENIDNNRFSSCSLEILNLHRKSNYQQNEKIAHSVTELGIAPCSSFIDILILNAYLKFPVGHG